MFKVDDAKGALTFAGTVPSGGKTPRDFAIYPGGDFLLAANQDSNNMVLFKIDGQTGALTPTGDAYEIGAPVSIVFAANGAAAAR
jgi:6-phosphogluconolactonase